MARAYTRQLSARIIECELSYIAREPINVALARDQHAAYERTLLQCGLELQRLPALPDSPDGVFVEDLAVLLGDHALLARPASAARAAESASAAQVLGAEFELAPLQAGTLDGGDVLRIAQRLYVGQSARTDAAGARSLAAWAGPLGYAVQLVPVHGCLHLKTAITCAGVDPGGHTLLIANPDWVDVKLFGDCEVLPVAPEEPFAANTLRIGSQLLVAAGQARLSEALRHRGFKLIEVALSELQKAEGGLTCLSLIDPR
jgi:dimethylargininase